MIDFSKYHPLIFVLAFVLAIGSYSLWQPIEGLLGVSEKNEGMVFYVVNAICFALYVYAYHSTTSGKWYLFTKAVFWVCVSRVFVELRPELSINYNWLEYVLAGISFASVYIEHYVKKLNR